MLSSIRKFSSSIYAKIFLFIVAIPFVFWGMGPLFTGGNINVVVVIDKEKHSTQDFVNFIQRFATSDQKININQIEEFLSLYIGDKLMQKEIEHFKIKLSDESLSKLIKHQKEFKRENKFSRVEYEKFLLKNNVAAVTFEDNLSKREKKKQLLDFVGGGILPSKFLINEAYNKINQKRDIQLIKLNDLFKKEIKISEEQIKSYYETNKEDYKKIYKFIKIIELNPKNLTGDIEYNKVFFQKIDEIDDIIFQGENLDYILPKFNLAEAKTFALNNLGEDTNLKIIEGFTKNLVKEIFNINEDEPTALIESDDKYFIIEVTKTEKIESKFADKTVKEKILLNLEMNEKRKIISVIISKINQNNFLKSDFDKFAIDKNLSIQNIQINSLNDTKILKEEVLGQIYSFPEKKVIVVHDINLKENFLIYIDKVKNVTIDEKTAEYEKYLNLAKIKITNELFNTYDSYIKKRYNIDINYKALDNVKNYFN
tara:strand:+ start:34 stop:1482 length:1449 start_codon:yes stop_codon:yes gene_type:complete